ncbi:C-X-C motif chemokine 11 [Alligator mississippiensis]|nr:C-X-C motif chemokine 11 [Alligator mississippiensis]
MKPLILLSFLLLLMAVVQGSMTSRRGRCLCIGPGMPAVHPKRVAKVEIYGPSNSCDHIEVIVTLKGKGQKCLNNKSPQAWQMIQKFMKKSNKAQRK